MKYTKALFIVLLLTGLTVTAFAQRGQMQRSPGDRPGTGMIQRFQQGDMNRPEMRIPDLTEEQREQIEELRLESRPQMVDLQNRLREQQARLRTLTTGSDPDRGAAEEVIDQIAASRAEMMKSRLALRMSIRELLTEKQRVRFDAGPGGFLSPGMRSRAR